MTTLADALGGVARPLARLVATWRHAPTWRARVIRATYPDLARALDGLDKALEEKIRPL